MTEPITSAQFQLPDRTPISILREDLIEYEHDLTEKFDDQRLRRAHVRASMALTDAIISYMKQTAYNFATQIVIPVQKHLGSNITKCPVVALNQKILDSELSLLIDKQVSVKDSGDIKITSVFLDFKRNVKFAMKSINKFFNTSIDINFPKDSGWLALTRSAEIRNRLVHPKPGENMLISDQELETIRQGYIWIVSMDMNTNESIMTSALKIQTELLKWVTEFQPEYIAQLKDEISALPSKLRD